MEGFYPLVVSPEKGLSRSFKGGGGIQMPNYPSSAVHETVTQLEILFLLFLFHISELHILFTR